MPDQTDQPRNEDQDNSANRRYADKFGNRIRDSKAVPRLPAPGDHGQVPLALVRRPRIELSLTQILGSTGAAVTAAFLGSRLGVAGTLIGAALASVISVVGGAIYTSSIKATRRRVSQVMVAVRSQDDDIHGENRSEKHDSGGRSQLVEAIPLLPVGLAAAEAVPAATSGAPALLNWRTRPAWLKRPTLGTAVIGALLTATVFAGALVIVTGYETVSGTAVSGGQSGGLTILGGGRVSPGTPTKIPTTALTTTPTSSATTGPATTGTKTSATTSTATTSSTVSTTPTTAGTPTTSPTAGTTGLVIPPTTATSSGIGTSTAASSAATSGSAAGGAPPNVPTTRTP